MKSFMIIIALLCLVSLPNPTVGLQKKPWPLPSDLANHHDNNFGDSKSSSWACSWVTDPSDPPTPPGQLPPMPNMPGMPKIPIPTIPNIPIPNIPGFPTIPIPKIPGIPNIQIPNIQIPNIPIPNIQFPTIPGLPNLPAFPTPPFESLLVSQSGELEKCLSTKERSRAAEEKCFSQIFSSWAENDFTLDKECCDVVVNMDKKCNEHFHTMFKSHFFAPLLQYSCQIKHSKKN